MKDIVVRAAKTFIQGFLGALVVNLPNSDLSSKQVLKSLLIGAISGGISYLMNYILKILKEESE